MNRIPGIIPAGFTQRAIGNMQFILNIFPDGLTVMFSIDPHGEDKWDNHLSLSRADCYPSWEEMKEIIYGNLNFFNPAREVLMVLPAKNNPEEYINAHKNCFHWYQEQ